LHARVDRGATGGVFAELGAGMTMAWEDKAFMSMLGVTFFANFNYWSHQPLLQVLATRLGADVSTEHVNQSSPQCLWGTFLREIGCGGRPLRPGC